MLQNFICEMRFRLCELYEFYSYKTKLITKFGPFWSEIRNEIWSISNEIQAKVKPPLREEACAYIGQTKQLRIAICGEGAWHIPRKIRNKRGTCWHRQIHRRKKRGNRTRIARIMRNTKIRWKSSIFAFRCPMWKRKPILGTSVNSQRHTPNT